MNTPFFSIIIPSRNRAQTLYYSIQTILNQTFADFELIISDNSDNDQTKELMSTFDDQRIKYHKTNGQLSMVDNWECSLQFIRGKYVLILGDDDGLLQNALDVAFHQINEHKPDALMFGWMGYNWPDQLNDSIIPNLVMVPEKAGENKFIDPESTINDVLASRAIYYVLPSVYYAFVSADLIHSVISSKGRFFYSLTPDVYSGLLICKFSKTIYKINDVLGIRGTSCCANGAAFGFKNEKTQYLKDDYNELNSLSPIKWNDQAPFIFCYFAFALESYFQLCEEFNMSVSRWKLFVFYLKVTRRAYFDYPENKAKVKEDLEIIKTTINKNTRLPKPMRWLLCKYTDHLSGKNDKRNAVVTANNAQSFGFNQGMLTINGTNFNINNILDLQVFMGKLLNIK